jgi:hypothetical protein
VRGRRHTVYWVSWKRIRFRFQVRGRRHTVCWVSWKGIRFRFQVRVRSRCLPPCTWRRKHPVFDIVFFLDIENSGRLTTSTNPMVLAAVNHEWTGRIVLKQIHSLRPFRLKWIIISVYTICIVCNFLKPHYIILVA